MRLEGIDLIIVKDQPGAFRYCVCFSGADMRPASRNETAAHAHSAFDVSTMELQGSPATCFCGRTSFPSFTSSAPRFAHRLPVAGCERARKKPCVNGYRMPRLRSRERNGASLET